MQKLSQSKNKANEFGFYTKIPNSVIDSDKLSKDEKILLIAIMRFNPSFPSYSRLMKMTGITSRNKVSETIKSLIDKNIIAYKKGSNRENKANEYRVYWDDDFAEFKRET